MAFKSSRVTLLVPLIITVGCSSISNDDFPKAAKEAIGEIETTNRLSMNRLSMNRLSMNGLSSSRLSPDGLTLAATDLLLDEPGRELLLYIIRCALPEGTSLTAEVDGVTYTFDGIVGMAPEWLDRKLSAPERRWISACLLAHVNGYGVEVPISLRGDHPALATTEDERAVYSLEEASFYGDLFTLPGEDLDEADGGEGETPGDEEPGGVSDAQRMYACGGRELQTACSGSAATFRPMRSCYEDDACALHFVGVCRDVLGTGSDACKSDGSGDELSKCYTEPQTALGNWPTVRAYKEVVTVYLSPDGWTRFYSSCLPLE